MFRFIVLFIITNLYVSLINADALGASDSVMIAKLSAIVKQLKKDYDEQLKSVREATIQSKELVNLNKQYREIRKEYKFITNFSLDREINNIRSDLEGLSMLDDLGNRDLESKLNIISGEIERRARLPEENKTELISLKAIEADLKKLKQLERTQRKILDQQQKIADGNMSSKQLANITARNSSLLLSLQLQKRGQETQTEINRLKNQVDKQRTLKSFESYFKNKGKE